MDFLLNKTLILVLFSGLFWTCWKFGEFLFFFYFSQHHDIPYRWWSLPSIKMTCSIAQYLQDILYLWVCMNISGWVKSTFRKFLKMTAGMIHFLNLFLDSLKCFAVTMFVYYALKWVTKYSLSSLNIYQYEKGGNLSLTSHASVFIFPQSCSQMLSSFFFFFLHSIHPHRVKLWLAPIQWKVRKSINNGLLGRESGSCSRTLPQVDGSQLKDDLTFSSHMLFSPWLMRYTSFKCKQTLPQAIALFKVY